MKKSAFILFSTLLLITGFSSCKKIKDAIFSGIDIKAPDIELAIPSIPFVPPFELNFGTYTQNFNLDSAVRAGTAGAFGASVVSSIKVKSVTFTLSNADDNNNLSNFQSARVMMSSKGNPDPVEFINLTFPTANTSTFTFTPTNSPELLTHLKSGELYYEMFGRVRKTTSKQLNMKISFLMTVK